MKLHDNSRFGRKVIVVLSSANFLKTQALIEVPGAMVRLSHFQKNTNTWGCLKRFQQRLNEFTGGAAAAEGRTHRQVQEFAFIGRGLAGNNKADDAAALHVNTQIVMQIIRQDPTETLQAMRPGSREFRPDPVLRPRELVT